MNTVGNDDFASDDLHLLWEIIERRFPVPQSLAAATTLTSAFIRVSKHIDSKIRQKHPDVLDAYLNLGEIVDDWDALRFRPDKTEIYLAPDESMNRLLIVVGYDQRGSLNLISMYRVRERNWRNRDLIQRPQR